MLETELLHYGYVFVFLGTLVEGNATLLTSAFLAHRGRLDLGWVILVAICATFLIDTVFFLIARQKGARWLESKASIGSRWERAARWARTRGGILMLASRFILGFRTIVPVACGVTGMSLASFLLWNIAGAILWAISFAWLGYSGSHLLTVIIDDIRRHEVLVAALIAIATLGGILYRTRGREWRDARDLARSPRQGQYPASDGSELS